MADIALSYDEYQTLREAARKYAAILGADAELYSQKGEEAADEFWSEVACVRDDTERKIDTHLKNFKKYCRRDQAKLIKALEL